MAVTSRLRSFDLTECCCQIKNSERKLSVCVCEAVVVGTFEVMTGRFAYSPMATIERSDSILNTEVKFFDTYEYDMTIPSVSEREG